MLLYFYSNLRLFIVSTDSDSLFPLSRLQRMWQQGIVLLLLLFYLTGAPGPCSQLLMESQLLICFCYFVYIILVTLCSRKEPKMRLYIIPYQASNLHKHQKACGVNECRLYKQSNKMYTKNTESIGQLKIVRIQIHGLNVKRGEQFTSFVRPHSSALSGHARVTCMSLKKKQYCHFVHRCTDVKNSSSVEKTLTKTQITAFKRGKILIFIKDIKRHLQ